MDGSIILDERENFMEYVISNAFSFYISLIRDFLNSCILSSHVLSSGGIDI